MNAVIKLSNTQYLKVLEELLFMKIQINDEKISTVKLPFFNFITLLVSIFTDYAKQTTEEPLNLYILSYIVLFHIYSKNTLNLLSNFIGRRRA
jgi:uncharacterized membrane protein YGL010W